MSIKEEVKLEIIKRLEGGDATKDLVNEYGISKSTIYYKCQHKNVQF